MRRIVERDMLRPTVNIKRKKGCSGCGALERCAAGYACWLNRLRATLAIAHSTCIDTPYNRNNRTVG